MSLRSIVHEGSILGDVVGAALPVGGLASDGLDVGVLAAVVEGPGTPSELGLEEHQRVPVRIAGLVLLDADSEELDCAEGVEVVEEEREVIVEVEGVLREGKEEGGSLEHCWHLRITWSWYLIQ